MNMPPKSVFEINLDDHIALFSQLHQLAPSVDQACEMLALALKQRNKIILCGNGGSAADCQHIAAEFTGRFIKDRPSLFAISITTDTSALTCIANDYSYSQVFSRQISGIGREGDCLIAISTSGNSENIIQAVTMAKNMGIATIGLLGRDGGKLASLCDLSIIVPSDVTGRVQEAHILIGHTLCGRVEQILDLVPNYESVK